MDGVRGWVGWGLRRVIKRLRRVVGLGERLVLRGFDKREGCWEASEAW